METVDVQMRVNGRERAGTVEPRLLLVHYLRDVLGLTATHIGCETSQCGACTVLMDGDAVKSCTVFAVQATGAEIETVESLATAEDLHPVQRAFQDEHGLQCGYCTPGMLMATCSLLRHVPDPGEEQIRELLHGNLCRCTGYQHIVAAVQRAAVLQRQEAGEPSQRAANSHE